ncbi:HAD-IC family P-type ATPase [Heliobacterium gestii]|uniref:P-type Ca(2+) transporter n=1 Tax=Heliomicrobium gestii TaxID=2699 RepID=A0A845LA29_HELGE|nr:cation-translocating P-type ATPase [Heliomicrobium gestii]MBM7866998.1 Ca2+-transporting ATPase [Heliomicrobium gestii]MZP43587.1 HAD-IC family P-type ATPase [Heliomicrobium gestii]
MKRKGHGRSGPETVAAPDKPWHQLTYEELCRTLIAGPQGLNGREAEARLARMGPNALREAEAVPLWRRLLAQFTDFMILVLLAATAISAFLGEMADAVTILLIVVMNAVLGFVQEYRAEQSLEALKKLTAPEATVLRDGREQRLAAHTLVPGDVVLLEAGDRVPADMRLLEVHDLEIDESPLTGESLPVCKQPEPIETAGVGIGDMDNMAFSGTSVTRGRGRGLVVATGMQTEMGRIAHLIESVGDDMTPLQRRLDELGKILVVLCLAICLVVVFIGLYQGEPVYRMVLTGVSLAVAAIPEGLPAIVTIVLAIGVQRMIRSRAIVRKLPAVETLGCATAICSDKTGTLTQNQMTVRQVWVSGERVDVSGQGIEPVGEFFAERHDLAAGAEGAGSRIAGAAAVTGGATRTGPSSGVGSATTGTGWSDLDDLFRAALLCNNARLTGGETTSTGKNIPFWGSRKKSDGEAPAKDWRLTGDPTEGALLVLAAKGGFLHQDVEAEFVRVEELPFDSDRKRMTVIVRDGKGQMMALVKGAPETVLSRCAFVRWNGAEAPLDDERRRRIVDENERMANEALRVLALACRPLPAGMAVEKLQEIAEEDLTFLGLAGMMDPPRPGVRQAVARCSQAGIRTIMITGDHPVTALAVARELGISNRSDEVLTGACLDELDDKQLEEKAPRVAVYARVSPAHKLRIVRALKSRGHVVAMTGDGVNDAPAVKEADIGVAMGKAGTDVTKEASSMVLSDDNFVTIVTAVEQGRAIYDNIRKFIRYLLSCNAGEVLVMFLASLLALPLPLLPVQLLWVNLVTDGLPAMALGVDTPDPDVMGRPPRHPKERILAGGLGRNILIWGTYCGLATLAVFAWGIYLGDLPLARTMAFCTLTFFQLFYVFDCRSDRYSIFELGWFTNPSLVGAVTLSALMQLAVVYLPPLQRIFQTVPLEPTHWLVVLFFSGGWLLLAGLRHFVLRPFSQRGGGRALYGQ